VKRLTTSVERNDEDVEVQVLYTFLRGTPQVNYQRNGDPGWPAEPDEIEISHVTSLVDGTEITLTDDEIERIEIEISDQEADAYEGPDCDRDVDDDR